MDASRPAGWHTLTPRIFAAEPDKLIAFLVDVFDAQGAYRQDAPAELHIGDSVLMVSGTEQRAAFPAFLYVYVADADVTYQRALAVRATVLEEPIDTPYGDRRAMVKDEWGNVWQIATRKRNLSTD